MEKISIIIYNAIMAYGSLGIALGVAIIILFIAQIALHIGLYSRVASFRLTSRPKVRENEPAISIIVPIFSDDTEFLDNGLVRLLGQDYKDFEVVAVYVGNNEDFFADLKGLQRLYAHLSPVHIDYSPRYPVSTKISLNVGIKSAKHDFVVITTTDTTPSSERWLSLLAKGFLYGDIVLGYSGVAPAKGLSNFLFREYRLADSVAWISSAIRRKPYSASRCALGFTRELYFSVRGFGHLNMSVGEDDLFLQQIATRDNVSVVLSPRATCTEKMWGGWRWWFRRTHELRSTHRYYPKGVRLPMLCELVLRVLFFASIITAIATMPWEFFLTAIILTILRYFVVLFVFVRNARRLNEDGLVARHFLFDLFEPILRLLVILSTGRGGKKWR
ncbi:MAG: glycosyltransferase [Alistipes sp.]|nr:glycosyltransferase [Alistipes sp.]